MNGSTLEQSSPASTSWISSRDSSPSGAGSPGVPKKARSTWRAMSRASPRPTCSAAAGVLSSASSLVMMDSPATLTGSTTASSTVMSSGVISDPSVTHWAWGSAVTTGMRRISCSPTGSTVVVCMATLIACTGCTTSGPTAWGNHALAKSLREAMFVSPCGLKVSPLDAEPLAQRVMPTGGGAGGRPAPGRGRPATRAPILPGLSTVHRPSRPVGVQQPVPGDLRREVGCTPLRWHIDTAAERVDPETLCHIFRGSSHFGLVWAAIVTDKVGDLVPPGPDRRTLDAVLGIGETLNLGPLKGLDLLG